MNTSFGQRGSLVRNSFVVFAIVLVGLLTFAQPLGVEAAPTTYSATTNLGGLDLNAWCVANHGKGSKAVVDPKSWNAYGWRCQKPNGQWVGMNLNSACNYQKQVAAYKFLNDLKLQGKTPVANSAVISAVYSNFNTPYSWSCKMTYKLQYK